MERYTMLFDWKNQHCQNDRTAKGNLQIQCNPYQITNNFLHRSRTKYFKICMETQKTQNIYSNLMKEKWNMRNQADFRLYTKVQSSIPYGTGTKTET